MSKRKYRYTRKQREAIAEFEQYTGFEVMGKGEKPYNELAKWNADWVQDMAEMAARILECAMV